MISILTLPFLACIALILIHVYFGSFVLRRGIIFIDLALAQWAALGYLIGHALHIENEYMLLLIGFLFTIIASILLYILKNLYNRDSCHEAVIGGVYIFGITAATSLISSTGMEGHHLKAMLSGQLLFLTNIEVLSSYVLYGLIAAVLFGLHSKFIKRDKRYELIFYVLFGAVVTLSVKMVGVLLVFFLFGNTRIDNYVVYKRPKKADFIWLVFWFSRICFRLGFIRLY